MLNVPFTLPARVTDDVKYLSDAITGGEIVGGGPFTKKSQLLLLEQINDKGKVLLTTSCTHALEIAAILLDIEPGDEIIVPSYTFVSTALAFYMQGARIVFADIRKDTLNIDESKIESLINSRTRAIVAVHYGGVACEMQELTRISNKYGLEIVEDNAHGLYGEYRGQQLGSIGSIATQSFHGTKNISCGEGGALVLNDERFFERAEVIQEKGTNRSKFLNGQVDKYTWVDKGSSYVLSDILAALLYSQLLNAQQIQNKRKEIWNSYKKELSGWAKDLGVSTPHIPNHCIHTYHLFYLLFPNGSVREKFIDYLSRYNITASSHYQPLHSSDFVTGSEKPKKDTCPIATKTSDCIVRLPLFTSMTENQLSHVIHSVAKFEF